MKQFLNDPPKFEPSNVFSKYKFLSRRYENVLSAPEQIEALVAWAKKEYWDAITYFSNKGNTHNVQFLTDNVSPEILLSVLSAFDDVMTYFNQYPDVWKLLNIETRRFLTHSRKYRVYSNQGISD